MNEEQKPANSTAMPELFSASTAASVALGIEQAKRGEGRELSDAELADSPADPPPAPSPSSAPAGLMAINEAIDRYRLAVHRGSNASLANLEARRRIEADAKQALLAEYQKQATEMQRLIAGHNEYNRVNRLITNENDKLCADVAALSLDSARLDWLEENVATARPRSGTLDADGWWEVEYWEYGASNVAPRRAVMAGTTVRAAIDAAAPSSSVITRGAGAE